MRLRIAIAITMNGLHTALGTCLTIVMVMGLGACSGLQVKGVNVLNEFRAKTATASIAAPVPLVSLTSDELYGRLSPDGRWLAFVSNQKDSTDIWLRDLTSGALHRLTRHVANDIQPTWSADGKKLAFVSMRADVKGDIYYCDFPKCHGENLYRLTRSRTADSYPVFSPDGKSIIFASGPEGQSRIVSIGLASGKRRPLSDWGASHPAISADGRHLAYTTFDFAGRSRIALQSLDGKKITGPQKRGVLTTGEYHVGFPTFSPDGRTVVFSRFYRGPPKSPRQEQSIASLWEITLALENGQQIPHAARLKQLTSDRYTALLPQFHRAGLVFTTRRNHNSDIVILPREGSLAAGKKLLRGLANSLANDWQRVFVWRRLAAAADSEKNEATYRAAMLELSLGEFSKAKKRLRTLTKANGEMGDFGFLAQIDLLLLPLKRLLANGSTIKRTAASNLLKRLNALRLPPNPKPRVASYLLLKRGELLFMSGQRSEALLAYESLMSQYPRPKALAAEAKMAMGNVLSVVRSPMQLADYYLSIFEQYPKQTEILAKVSQQVIDLYRFDPPRERVKSLRELIDRHSSKLQFAALAQREIGEIYEQLKEIDLAIGAMEEVVRRYSRARRQLAPAAFSLGRLCLKRANELGKKGRAVEALKYYSRALFAYQQIQGVYEPNNEFHRRAKREYLRLALRDGITLQLKRESVMAKKRYRAILQTDKYNLHAHRQLFRLSDKSERRSITEDYAQRVDSDPTDYLAHYGLGYAATLSLPLTHKKMEKAEQHLNRMIELYPRSPFGHMTLGWVLEMQERYLGRSRQGFLERAIVRYEKAFALNDRELDPQTEGDLLVNLCNAFAGLGNGWRRAYKYCSEREDLKLPFLSKRREAHHYLVYGRASSAEGNYGKAERLFDHAIDLFKDLANPALEAESVARKALNSLLQGNYRRASQEFLNAETMLKKLGDNKALSQLAHSRSYALLRQTEYRAALKALDQAKQSFLRFGQRQIDKWPPYSLVARSTAAFGFDRLDIQHLQLALSSMVFQRIATGKEYLASLQARRQSRLQAFALRKDDELLRELSQIANQMAIAEKGLGRPKKAVDTLLKAAAVIEKLQTKETEGFVLEPSDFVLQVALLLNVSELLLKTRQARSSKVREVFAKLVEMERRRALRAKKTGQPLLPQRLRLALWTNLAFLGLKSSETSTSKASTGTKAAKSTEQIQANIKKLAQPVSQSLRALQRAKNETLPGNDTLVDPPESARPKGTLSGLWRPLGKQSRWRWHIRAAFNLAQVAVTFVPNAKLSEHRSTDMLRRLLKDSSKTSEGLEALGNLAHLLRAEVAFRDGDLEGMKTTARSYFASSPFLIELAELNSNRSLNDFLYSRAVGLALRENDIEQALAFAEDHERRGFVESLIKSQPQATGLAGKSLGRLLALGQLPREKKKKAYVAEMAKLKALSPRVAKLFDLSSFSLKSFNQCLDPDDMAFSLLLNGGEAYLVGIVRGLAPTIQKLGAPGRERMKRKAFAKKLNDALDRLSRGAKRVYLDLGRLGELPKVELPARQIINLASLATLRDAFAMRNLARAPTLVAGTHPLTSALAKRVEASSLTGKDLHKDGLFLPFDRAGLLIWTSPLRFDMNLLPRLLLFDPKGHRLDDWQLNRLLGDPLRAHALVIGDLQLTSGHERQQRVALMRLLHAAGIPSIATAHSMTQLDRVLPKFVTQIKSSTAALASNAAGLDLWGYAGVPSEKTLNLAKTELKRNVFGGAKAYKKRRFGGAIDQLENALRLMSYLKTYKYQDGALNFLAKAYTLNKDYRRALPRMAELIAIRRKAVHRSANKKTQNLKAQGKLVAALQSMAWLRYRKRDYTAALKANAEALEVYKAVKRPLAARVAYAQRSLIAEADGQKEEALRYAKLNLKTALASLKKKDLAKQKTTVSKAAMRLARLLRKRFSFFVQAKAAAKLALSHSPLTSNAAPKSTTKSTMKSTMKTTAASARLNVEILLEIARIAGARGDYGEAVKQAQAAHRLAKELGLKNVDAALLEVVNSLYYLGAYGQALRLADRGLGLPSLAGRRQIQFHNAKGSIFAALGHTTSALKSLRAALGKAKVLRLPREIAASHNNIGNAFRLGGRFNEAKDSFRKALRLDQEHGDKLGMAFNFANLGLAEAAMGRRREARSLLKKAIGASDKIGAPLNALKALVGLCRLSLEERRAKESLAFAESGLQRAKKLGLRNWVWKFQLLAGRALLRSGKPSKAQRAFEEGLKIIEEAPPRMPRIAGVPKVDLDPNDLYDSLIDLFAKQKKSWAALALAERRRARSFVDLVSNDIPRLGKDELGNDLVELNSLQRRLEVARSEQTRHPDRANTKKSVVKLQKELKTVRDSLGQRAPQLGEFLSYLPQSNVEVIERLRRLAKRLAERKSSRGENKKTIYVTYYHTGSQLLIWTLKGSDLNMVSVARSEKGLRGDIEIFRRQMLGFHPIKASARRLYRLVLKPVAHRLDSNDVVIIPYGALHTVPFAALHDGKDYLSKRYAFRYGSSFSAFAKEPASLTAEPNYLSVGWAGKTNDIPMAEKEAENFKTVYADATLLLGEDAKRNDFLAAVTKASLVHIATHAHYLENAPLSSSLELADGPLELTDILQLKLNGPLVVISACETGKGLLDGAHGTVSFQRAFLAAGASALLSSLWRVNDLGSALLMKYFFRELKEGQHAAVALQNAQNELRKRYAHPAFWAAFRLDDLR